jgi:hypothetical protein
MAQKRGETFRLTLTAEQAQAIRRATGKDAEAIELKVEELEERIAPARLFDKI